MIDENDNIDGIVKCIMEDGFESGLAESFYDEDRFMSFLDEKYDNQYNEVTNNGENTERWPEYLNEKAKTEDNRSDEFFDHYKNEYEDYVYDVVMQDTYGPDCDYDYDYDYDE